MANVQISDLALATLPLDTANTFFELQTVEGGIDVSRKISAADLGIGGGVLTVNSGQNIVVDNTDPMNPIVNFSPAPTGAFNMLVANGAGTDWEETDNLQVLATQVAVQNGFNFRIRSGGVFALNTDDDIATALSIDGPLTAGGETVLAFTGNATLQTGGMARYQISEVNSRHVFLDFPVFLEERAAAGGSVAAFGQLWVRDDTPNVLVFTDDAGTDFVLGSGGGTPAGNDTNVQFNNSGAFGGTDDFRWDNSGGKELEVNANDMFFSNLAGTPQFSLDQSGPAASPRAYFECPVAIELGSVARASLYIEEQAAAVDDFAGFGQIWVRSDTPNVLMFTDDAGTDFVLNAAASFNTPVDIAGDINTATPPTTEAITALLRFTDLAGDDVISTLGHSASNVLQLSNLMQGGNFQLNLIDSLGNARAPIFVDPADQVRLDYPGFQPKKKVLGDLRRMETASSGIDVYGSADNDGDPTLGEVQDTNITYRNNSGVIVGSLAFNTSGALELTNDVYQSRIDLYTTDDAGGSIAQIEMAFGAANGITFFTHSGGRQYRMVDSGDKKDLTARFNITGADQGSTAGQDAAIGFVNNILTPVDRAVLGFEGSDQLNLRCDVGELHLQIDDGGPTDGVTIAPGGAVTLFENGTAQAATTALGLDVRDTLKVGALGSTTGVIKLGEQANADADEAGFGQLWVRNDVPNNLFFTDDSGNDFLVAGTGAGGDISAGSNLLADTTFVAVANVSPEINREYFVLAAVEISAPAADDGQVQFTIDTNARFYGTLTNTEDDTTQIIEGQTAEVVTNSVVVPTSGAATPGGTYCTIVGRLIMGATTGTMSLRCAKNADTGADGFAIRGAIKLIPIDP